MLAVTGVFVSFDNENLKKNQTRVYRKFMLSLPIPLLITLIKV